MVPGCAKRMFEGKLNLSPEKKPEGHEAISGVSSMAYKMRGTMLVTCKVLCRSHDRGTARASKFTEGGSNAIYLLGAGLTCFEAMFLRSRLAKPTQP